MSLLISLPWHKIASVLWVTDSWTIVASSVYKFLLTHGRGRECLKTLRNYFKYFLLWGVCACVYKCMQGWRCALLCTSVDVFLIHLTLFLSVCVSVHLFLFHWIWSMPFWVDLLARKFQDIHLLYLPLQCCGYKPNFYVDAGDPK